MRGRDWIPAFLVLVLAAPGCGREEGRADSRLPDTTAAASAAPVAEARGVRPAAAEPAAPAARQAPAFDEDAAWDLLARQVAFGPRVPGTEAHRRCADWLAGELEAAGARVTRDRFTYRDPAGTVWPLENILGSMGPEGTGRILLIAHWDSRPWADMDPDPARRTRPIPGANDGASGVAVLLQVAREIRGESLPRGVDVLLVDGEDLGHADDRNGYCRGSIHFTERGIGVYWRGIVLDMVGDADLAIPVEGYSRSAAPDVVDWIWSRGRKLAPEVFVGTPGPTVYDDHIPFLQAGLPTADVIDMDYAVWHTAADDLAAVHRRSLGAVGRVVLSLVRDP